VTFFISNMYYLSITLTLRLWGVLINTWSILSHLSKFWKHGSFLILKKKSITHLLFFYCIYSPNNIFNTSIYCICQYLSCMNEITKVNAMLLRVESTTGFIKNQVVLLLLHSHHHCFFSLCFFFYSSSFLFL